jgi:sugar lactone lactonase YvrE
VSQRSHGRSFFPAPLLASALLGLSFLALLATPVRASLLVSSSGTNSVLRYNGSTGAFIEPLVSSNSSGLAAPNAMVINPRDGTLLVASPGTNSIEQFDLNVGHNGEPPGAWMGTYLSANNLDPAGMVFDPSGLLYIASYSTRSVLLYTNNNQNNPNSLQTFASGGGLGYPSGLAIGPDRNLYVASYDNSQVIRFSGATGAPMSVFVPSGSGGLSHPSGIAFGPDGSLYVASQGTNSVFRYNGQTGALIGTFASGNGLSSPSGLAFGPDGNLYACSSGNGSVLRYNGQTGAFIDPFVSAGMGGLSGPLLGILFTPLRAPSALEAEVASTSQIRLNWMDESDDETAYAVWRMTSTTGWARVAVVPAHSSTYVDSNLSPNTMYAYRVRATNNLGASDWSPQVSCRILLPVPQAPTGLLAAAVSSTQINLSWTDNSTDETAFSIWRRGGSGDWVRVGVVGADITTFSDTDLTPSTSYTYRVRATNNGGASAWTDEVTVTTGP